jgi:hypothetical protein
MSATPTRPPRMGTEKVGLGLWGAVTGLAPHVLHHVGPLAGAALLAGAAGRVFFGGAALLLSLPLLIRIYRRFGTWVAPVVALVIMSATFLLSSFVIGPAINGGNDDAERPGVVTPNVDHRDHENHAS